jgi:hypothetical protein
MLPHICSVVKVSSMAYDLPGTANLLNHASIQLLEVFKLKSASCTIKKKVSYPDRNNR